MTSLYVITYSATSWTSYIFFCSFSCFFFTYSMPEFLIMRKFLRVFWPASFWFLRLTKSQTKPICRRWTVEESNLWRAGLQPAALPSELTVQIRRCKIAFPSFSPYFCSFFSIRVPVPSASARKILTRLRLKNHPGCLFRDKEKTACLDFSSQTVQNVIKSSYVTQSLRIFLTLTLQPSLIPRIFLFCAIVKTIDWPCKTAHWTKHICCRDILFQIILFRIFKSLS